MLFGAETVSYFDGKHGQDEQYITICPHLGDAAMFANISNSTSGGNQELIAEVLNILRTSPTCAAAYGGIKSAEKLLDKMTIYNVPSPYAGPVYKAYNLVTSSNNGAKTGWEASAAVWWYQSRTSGSWNGGQYGVFVGTKFNSATLGQRATLLFHEMGHVYSAGYANEAVDGMYSLYNPYGGPIGGIPATCGTSSLPPID